MSKLPRNLNADDLLSFLKKNEYEVVRQKGSHIRLNRLVNDKEHHITIPYHKPIKVGTLNSIINDLATHLSVPKQKLISHIIKNERL